MSGGLADLARLHAIAPEYEGIDGRMKAAPEATLQKLLTAFGVDRAAPGTTYPPPALRAPEGVTCYLPDAPARAWGVAIQLYQLRSARNWGIGDFADLAVLAGLCGEAGADFLGVNPLHALFLARPGHCSPFSPSNRRFLNPLYIAVDRLPGFDLADCPDAALAAARAGDLIDYPAVAALKRAALRALWRRGAADEGLAAFRAAGAAALERHALFEAISERMVAEGRGAGWTAWPEEWQDPESPAAAAFAEDAAGEVDFHLWLQYLADRQLGEAREACLAAGMRIGLYLDFAVGEVPDGSGAWSNRAVTVPGVRIGAPPDYFNEAGQDWGLAPLSPVAMAASRAAPFRALMDDATRRAGALRIDHAMALWQLFLIPDGMDASGGTYVRYPVEDMIRALAEASHANRTMVVGEDLGNVPEGFREVMEAAGILSYRILLFERGAGGFIAPEDYPRRALVCISTHDLPTFQGWWRGDDVRLRAAHGLISADAAALQSAARERERGELVADLVAAGLMSRQAADGLGPEHAPEALVVAVHRHLARAPSRLFDVRLVDIAGDVEPVNVPSTTDEYPNWRRRIGLALEDLAAAPLFRDVTAALSAERPKDAP